MWSFAFAVPATASPLRDLHFGEALFYAHQEDYFEALERLDAEIVQHHRVDEPTLDSMIHHIEEAEFSVGDFELFYRMHHRAGRAIKAVLEANVADEVRNDAAYRLARIHFQKDQPAMALDVLDAMKGKIPEALGADVAYLRANVYLALGRPGDAIETLTPVQDAKSLAGFSNYNLGIAMLRDGKPELAFRQLDRAGRVRSTDRTTLAIRDKSNLVLGTLLLEAKEFDRAQTFLDRVRLSGPFSNQALLRAGRADLSAGRFDRALVPWSVLVDRDVTDSAVQEARLALPYAYGKLGVHGRAAVLYGEAVETFQGELQKLDASIHNIRSGDFLEALVREEIRHDKEWVVRLRELPDAPETFYLVGLMASHDFQTALQNYLDLDDLRGKLLVWDTSLDAFGDVIRLRRGFYEPRLPKIDRAFRRLDAQMRLRLEQREHVRARLEGMLTAPRADYLATAEEQGALRVLAQLAAQLVENSSPEGASLRARTERLEGMLRYRLETDYHVRLTETHEHLRALEQDVEALDTQYDAFVRTRQSARHSYVGYSELIKELRSRVQSNLTQVDDVMARQGRVLESVAINELELRRTRLTDFQNQARFAYADSYDRAAKAQAQ
ncbi:MAG TPA: tetratricopeptide repeat protein [Myxococcales bacterium]|nr:tetratricopeptide repeat protein [Myxococcales bacterium]